MLVLRALILLCLFCCISASGRLGIAQANNNHIEFVSSIGEDVQAVAVQGTYAYIGESNTFAVIDVYDPAFPVSIATLPLPKAPLKIKVIGGFAYAIDEDRFFVIDVSAPNNPVPLGSYDLKSLDFDVVQNLAYLAAGKDGVQIIDVSNPDDLNLCCYNGLVAPVTALDVVGERAFISTNYNGFCVLDVSTPNNARYYDGVQVVGETCGVESTNDITYVAYYGGLMIMNTSNPQQLQAISFYNTAGETCNVTVSDQVAYLTNGTNGVLLLDISDPSSPLLIDSYNTPGSATRIALQADLLYVADGSGGLQILRVERLPIKFFFPLIRV